MEAALRGGFFLGGCFIRRDHTDPHQTTRAGFIRLENRPSIHCILAGRMHDEPCHSDDDPAMSPGVSDVCALILAAGHGERLGLGPKAFVEHQGRTLLQHAVDFVAPFVSEILVGLPPERLDEGRRLVESERVRCLAGAAVRQETLAILIAETTQRFVVVHNCSDPLASQTLLKRVLKAIWGEPGVVPALPVPVRWGTATVEGGYLRTVVPRERLVSMQGPQIYDGPLLREVMVTATRQGWVECGLWGLLAQAGHRVRTIPGEDTNVKITYPEDLKLLTTGSTVSVGVRAKPPG